MTSAPNSPRSSGKPKSGCGAGSPGNSRYPRHRERQFEAELLALIGEAGRSRQAVMCAEAVPWRCHRSLIADALTVRGVRALEIVSPTRLQEHTLPSFARVHGTEITYPPEQTTLPC